MKIIPLQKCISTRLPIYCTRKNTAKTAIFSIPIPTIKLKKCFEINECIGSKLSPSNKALRHFFSDCQDTAGAFAALF